ncbi:MULTISPECIES: flagellar hook-length control protein FliK [unclassified Oceanobacillus]|nr:flagellar hook-length control protein FliK [Oceanobacillus sp. AG]
MKGGEKLEANMTLWQWVAFMDYPTKVGSSPAESDELQNGSDFTYMLDEKLTDLTKTKQENRTDETSVEQDDLLEMLRSFFTKLDKEDLLSILDELEETDGVSWDGMLTVEEKAVTEPSTKKTEDDPQIVKETDEKADLVETILTLIHALPTEKREEFIGKFTGQMEQVSETDFARISGDLPSNLTNNISVNPPVDMAELEKEVNELFVEIEQKLSLIETQEDVAKVAPKILEYLMAWQQLSEKAGNQTELLPFVKRETNNQTPAIWQDLVKLYQQKMNFHTKSVYALESKVTNTDIIRWIGNAFEMTVHKEQPVTTAQAQPVQMPISQVEQMVIHLPSNSDNNQVGKALIEQFNRLIDSKSIVFQQPKGQLAITLKPANLGEMLVRFTQVDGEMIVKIMVTTNAAKKMLEANGQQLRHMFAPHQVVIERNETLVQQSQATYKEEGQAEGHEQDDQSTSDHKEEKDENETFASLFDELILNEKV